MSDAPFDLVDAKDSFTDTDWFHSCQKSQIPYVVVRSGDATADVLWDFVTLPPSCDARLRAQFPALEREARAIFDRFAIADSYARIKPTLICFDHLPFDAAKRAAEALYALIASYLPRGPQITREPSVFPSAASTSRRLWIEHNDPSSSAA